MGLNPNWYTTQEWEEIVSQFNTRDAYGRPDYRGAEWLINNFHEHPEPKYQALAREAYGMVRNEFYGRLNNVPGARAELWMNLEHAVSTGQMGADYVNEFVREELPGPPPTDAQRWIAALPVEERPTAITNFAAAVASNGERPGEVLDRLNARTGIQTLIPHTVETEQGAAQMLADLGIQKPRGATAVNTLRETFKKYNGENAPGTRLLAEGVPIQFEKPSDDAVRNYQAQQLARTRFGQQLKAHGRDAREYLDGVLGKVTHAEIQDGIAMRLARNDSRKPQVDLRRRPDANRMMDMERKVQVEAITELAEMDGRNSPGKKHRVNNSMDYALRAAYAQHEGKSDSDFFSENHVPERVREEYRGLDTGADADDDSGSTRDDFSSAYENSEG